MILAVITLTALVVIRVEGPDHITKAPLYALAGATAVAIWLTPPAKTLFDQAAHAFVGLMSAVAALGAAWNWFLSIEEVALFWEALALILVGVFTVAILKWFTNAILRLQELMARRLVDEGDDDF